MPYTVSMFPVAGWNWLGLMPWIWLALVILFSVIEALTMTLTTVWFAAAALVMVFVAMLHVPFPAQILLFVLFSAVLLFFTRPLALKFLKKKTATNADSLIGSRCKLLTAVTRDEKGTVRLKGVEWSVASADGSPVEAGTECVIKEIKGNTLIV